MVEAGLLDLGRLTTHCFPMAQWEEALETAEGLPPFSFAILEPNA